MSRRYSTSPAYLVYRDREDRTHFENIIDVPEIGTLIDPDTGDDMPIVGWSVSDNPHDAVFTSDMLLVYVDQRDKLYFQTWSELECQGSLIDPDTGDDMDVVGWTERIA